ncbi:MAG: hypothetical protein AAF558_00385 [Verrucomicrobiota bacterium]
MKKSLFALFTMVMILGASLPVYSESCDGEKKECSKEGEKKCEDGSKKEASDKKEQAKS